MAISDTTSNDWIPTYPSGPKEATMAETPRKPFSLVRAVRKIRACEDEVAAQLIMEYMIAESLRARLDAPVPEIDRVGIVKFGADTIDHAEYVTADLARTLARQRDEARTELHALHVEFAEQERQLAEAKRDKMQWVDEASHQSDLKHAEREAKDTAERALEEAKKENTTLRADQNHRIKSYAELRTELAASKEALARMLDERNRACQQHEAAASKLWDADANAARYLWVREHAQKVALFSMDKPSVQIRFPIVARNERYQSIPKDDELDAAIDRARSAEKGLLLRRKDRVAAQQWHGPERRQSQHLDSSAEKGGGNGL